MLGLATVLSLAALTTTASAHYVYRSGWLFWSGDDCVNGYSEVSHGTGNGYSKSNVTINNNSGSGGSCSGNFARPGGYIRIRQLFMYWNNGWSICRDTGTLYNSYNTNYFEVTRTHNGRCGTYNYDTLSTMYEYNGSWHGGDLWSGDHKL
jgi:hypothetical protein